MPMRDSYTRAFKEPRVMAEMLAFRLAGVPLKIIATHYGVDRTSVRHWCVLLNIVPISSIQLTHVDVVLQPKQPKTYKYADIMEEKDVNQGKNYKDYLKEYSKKHDVHVNRYAPHPDNLYEVYSNYN